MVTSTDAVERPLLVPFWRRARLWLALVAVVVLVAVIVGAFTGGPDRSLDPSSPAAGGSRALARVLAGYGTTVRSTSDLEVARQASGTVLLTAPDDYSDAQLRQLAAGGGRLVALAPGTRATRALLPGASPDPDADPSDSPGCALAGAEAAGDVDPPDGTLVYDLAGSGTRCYGGAVVVRGDVVLLGSADLLRNDMLARHGVAALDVNLLSVDRTVPTLTWLLPGADAAGSGPASVWDLFPDGVYRAFVWAIVLGALVMLWRGRRLGGVVREPLPVVVRAAELVEGHGRLYERAGARDRAGHTLRTAATSRLAARVGLPAGASPEQVAAAVSARLRRPVGDVHTVLAGPVPADDAALVHLATELDRLEVALGDPKENA